MTRLRAAAGHVASLAAYTALALVQTYPLVRHLGTHLPGLGLGDNVAFAWNLWWMREALGSAQPFLHSPMLFAPVGTPLVLHTHTAVAAAVGATLLQRVEVITAQNLWLIASLALNGWSSYCLARAVTGRTFGAAIAGALLVMAPAVTIRLMGHYNLVAIWPLILACLALVRWRQRPTATRALLVGVAGGVLLYVDYYLVVYFVVFTVAFAVVMHGRKTLHVTRRPSRAAPVLIVLASAAFVLAGAIGLSARDAMSVFGMVISVRTPTNALTAGWLLLLTAVFLRHRWTLDVGVTGAPALRTYGVLAGVASLTALVIALPLLPAVIALVQTGSYVTSAASLRSGPRGVDVGTLLLGPPFAGWSGASVRGLYNILAIDVMESSAWIGLGLLAFAIVAWRARQHEREASRWVGLACVFAVWSLGPWLIALGHNTGLLLPQAIARLVPVLNNARIPGRALLVATMCLGVVAAMAIERLRAERRHLLLAAIIATAALESIAAPLPLTELPAAGVYATVAADPSNGTVLPVPFGLRDGFGERGRLEPDVMYAQTIHRHPLAGGFIARLPAAIPAWYDAHEPFAALLRASAGQAAEPPPCAISAAGLRAANVTFLVFYPADGSPALRRLLDRLPLRLVADDGGRMLFRVLDACPGEP